MYPKPVQDLAGWNITSIGTGYTSIVISADDSLIAWGASPTYGELVRGSVPAFMMDALTHLTHVFTFSFFLFFARSAGVGRFAKVVLHAEGGNAHGRHENPDGCAWLLALDAAG